MCAEVSCAAGSNRLQLHTVQRRGSRQHWDMSGIGVKVATEGPRSTRCPGRSCVLGLADSGHGVVNRAQRRGRELFLEERGPLAGLQGARGVGTGHRHGQGKGVLILS